MNRISVSSSNLKSVGYDPESSTLEIEFNNNRVYQYFNVPESVYQGLINAASHGKYHHRHIKDNYRYSQIR
ncbi:KTSC domain-containing protein [Haladaptatus sp. R4]|uniref:KTSC domain-containing protein n=1 Tax=Haladaptatus sp. R4 TaxID=1679489 RepID=UPI0009ECE5A6